MADFAPDSGDRNGGYGAGPGHSGTNTSPAANYNQPAYQQNKAQNSMSPGYVDNVAHHATKSGAKSRGQESRGPADPHTYRQDIPPRPAVDARKLPVDHVDQHKNYNPRNPSHSNVPTQQQAGPKKTAEHRNPPPTNEPRNLHGPGQISGAPRNYHEQAPPLGGQPLKPHDKRLAPAAPSAPNQHTRDQHPHQRDPNHDTRDPRSVQRDPHHGTSDQRSVPRDSNYAKRDNYHDPGDTRSAPPDTHHAISGQRSVPPGPQQDALYPHSVPRDPNQGKHDPRTVQRDPYHDARERKYVPLDTNQVKNARSASRDANYHQISTSPGTHRVARNQPSVPRGPQHDMRDQQMIKRDQQTVSGDPRSAPGDQRSVPGDPLSAPRDQRSVPGDPRSAPRDQRSVSGDQHSAPRDQRSVSGDPRSVPRDQRSVSLDPNNDTQRDQRPSHYDPSHNHGERRDQSLAQTEPKNYNASQTQASPDTKQETRYGRIPQHDRQAYQGQRDQGYSNQAFMQGESSTHDMKYASAGKSKPDPRHQRSQQNQGQPYLSPSGTDKYGSTSALHQQMNPQVKKPQTTQPIEDPLANPYAAPPGEINKYASSTAIQQLHVDTPPKSAGGNGINQIPDQSSDKPRKYEKRGSDIPSQAPPKRSTKRGKILSNQEQGLNKSPQGQSASPFNPAPPLRAQSTNNLHVNLSPNPSQPPPTNLHRPLSVPNVSGGVGTVEIRTSTVSLHQNGQPGNGGGTGLWRAPSALTLVLANENSNLQRSRSLTSLVVANPHLARTASTLALYEMKAERGEVANDHFQTLVLSIIAAVVFPFSGIPLAVLTARNGPMWESPETLLYAITVNSRLFWGSIVSIIAGVILWITIIIIICARFA